MMGTNFYKVSVETSVQNLTFNENVHVHKKECFTGF